MPSALFVSQCHHFSPVIYFIAISVLLAHHRCCRHRCQRPYLHPCLHTTTSSSSSSISTFASTLLRPPALLLLHLSPDCRHSAPPRGSLQAFHPGPSVPTFLAARGAVASLLARSLARAASTNNTFVVVQNTPPLRNAIPRSLPPPCLHLYYTFLSLFFSLPPPTPSLSPCPDITVRRSPLPAHFLLFHLCRSAASAFSPKPPISTFLFPFTGLSLSLSRARTNAYRITTSCSPSLSLSLFVRCSVSCFTSGTRKSADGERERENRTQ